MAKKWIAGAIKHPKKLAKAAKAKGKLGKRARLAQTLRGFHHSAPMGEFWEKRSKL